MKRYIKAFAFIGVMCIIGATIAAVCVGCESQPEYLRIHIRANSNSDYDQAVKYEVKDAIVEYMSLYLQGVSSKQEAMDVVAANLDNMTELAKYVLAANGYNYGAKVSLRSEEFPARNYGDLTLGSGVYDAIIIELGSGEGDNWWCVAFPPLCFVGSGEGEHIKYKSKIVELWNKVFNRD
ncbi:MAG: stage II sporulation protein R [Clostridia bacterium]|nr:stage II sporulation protein R [Clostridia bacterium]